MNLRRLNMAVMLISGIGIFAQSTMNLSLQDAKQLALKNNVSIKNSELDLKIAQKKIWETTAIGLPHAEVKGTYQHIFNPPSFGFPTAGFSSDSIPRPNNDVFHQEKLGDGGYSYMYYDPANNAPLMPKDNTTFDISVSQLLFNGAYIIGLRASKVYYNLSKQSLEKTLIESDKSVAQTYYMIEVADASIENLKVSLANVQKTCAEIKEMHKQGFVEQTDVDQLEVASLTIQNTMNAIESNRKMGMSLLKIQLGIDDATQITLTDKIGETESLLQQVSATALLPFNVANNVDYKLVKTSEDLSKLDYQRELTTFLPTISAYYNHNEKLKQPSFDFTPKDIVGINLSLPLFSSGERLAKVSQKKMALDQSQNTTYQVERSLKTSATALRDDLVLKLDKFEIQKKTKNLSNDIYNRNLEKYKLGMLSSMELMNSQNQYISALTNFYQSIYELINAEIALKAHLNIN